ncbi:uncharacterized protein LOC112450538 [Kryptolebias marmoratus]|uniref:uncharacterized protein LOC112450538 n=1 Tax=Kryptolebias marmoratus TaxID=37003 RepID=UPI000D52F645|nr:uncharacterized protein LOC112450538 [Kryptolebias marmoratus]
MEDASGPTNTTQQQINADDPPVRPDQNPFEDAEMILLRQALETARRNLLDLVSVGWFLRRARIRFERKIRHAKSVLEMKYVDVINIFKHLDDYFQSCQTDKALRKKENGRLRAELHKATVREKRERVRRKKLASELQKLQQKCTEQEAEMAKREKRTNCFRREMIALTREHLQTLIALRQKEDKHEESERRWRARCEELEVRLRDEKTGRRQEKRSKP